jgi:hypothetical protein
VNIKDQWLYLCVYICIYTYTHICRYKSVFYICMCVLVCAIIHFEYPNWKPKTRNVFEHWHEVTSGKFHTWPYVMGCSQNTATLKILYKATFRLFCIKVCRKCNWMSNLELLPILKISYVHANIPKSEKSPHLKHFWPQALWIGCTDP